MSKCKGNVIITIGRTFGSGGREIGKKVAMELEIPFYDKEKLEAGAKDKNISSEFIDLYDEKQPDSLLYSMAFSPYDYRKDRLKSLDIATQNMQINIIKYFASQGSCVIVGRRADKILRDEYDTFNVFISASLEKRAARVAKRDGLSEEDSIKKILKADRARRAFYNYFIEGNWGEAENYNLCIDSGDLGTDNSAAMILQYLKLKGKLD